MGDYIITFIDRLYLAQPRGVKRLPGPSRYPIIVAEARLALLTTHRPFDNIAPSLAPGETAQRNPVYTWRLIYGGTPLSGIR